MYFFFVKQKTAYELRISDWSSDVCSSDLYSPTDLKKCPKTEIPGDGFLLYEGVCSAQVNEPVTGSWKAEDNKLCVDIAWAGKTQIKIGRASCRDRVGQYV